MPEATFDTHAAAMDAAMALMCDESGLDHTNEFDRQCMMDTIFECMDVRCRYAGILAMFMGVAVQMADYGGNNKG